MRAQAKHLVQSLAASLCWVDVRSDQAMAEDFIRSARPLATTTRLVRVGGEGDGGYLLPDDLDGLRACVSPGVCEETGFDDAMAARGMDVFMADASVDGPPRSRPEFHFLKKHLGVVDDDDTIRLDTFCASIPETCGEDLLLQMDIEGAEYSVLMDASDALMARFRVMVIEFHHLTGVFARFPLTQIRAVFEKLQRTHYVVHIHPNNMGAPLRRGGLSVYPAMEFTFHRKDRTRLDPGRALVFPHPLDRKNVAHRPAAALPRCWQGEVEA